MFISFPKLIEDKFSSISLIILTLGGIFLIGNAFQSELEYTILSTSIGIILIFKFLHNIDLSQTATNSSNSNSKINIKLFGILKREIPERTKDGTYLSRLSRAIFKSLFAKVTILTLVGYFGIYFYIDQAVFWYLFYSIVLIGYLVDIKLPLIDFIASLSVIGISNLYFFISFDNSYNEFNKSIQPLLFILLVLIFNAIYHKIEFLKQFLTYEEVSQKHESLLSKIEKNSNAGSMAIAIFQNNAYTLNNFFSELSEKINNQRVLNTQLKVKTNKFTESVETIFKGLENQSNNLIENYSRSENIRKYMQKTELVTSDLTENIVKSKEQNDTIILSIEESLNILGKVRESFTELKQINDIIAMISDQTNLLALNASIESAKAGTNGRGFSVIASEIRKLADYSSENAKMIYAITKKSTKQLEDAISSGILVKNSVTDQIKVSSRSMEDLQIQKENLQLQFVEIQNLLYDLEDLRSSVVSLSDNTIEQKVEIESLTNFIESLDSLSLEISEKSLEVTNSLEDLETSSNIVSSALYSQV